MTLGSPGTPRNVDERSLGWTCLFVPLAVPLGPQKWPRPRGERGHQPSGVSSAMWGGQSRAPPLSWGIGPSRGACVSLAEHFRVPVCSPWEHAGAAGDTCAIPFGFLSYFFLGGGGATSADGAKSPALGKSSLLTPGSEWLLNENKTRIF